MKKEDVEGKGRGERVVMGWDDRRWEAAKPGGIEYLYCSSGNPTIRIRSA
jgi:hypothetical protein